MEQMLNDIRVIDLGAFITGPLAAMMVADLGADVIKVEAPGGDPFRRGHGNTYGPTFAAYNRNKRSIVLDTANEADRQKLLALIDSCDVLIDNFRPATLEKAGLHPQVLRERNPRLIHCSITGFGDTGPYRNRPAFDAVGQALSGISSLMMAVDEPKSFGPTITDNVTGMYACYGILGALIKRTSSGSGCRLEVNMLEASMAFIQDAYTNFTLVGLESGPLTRVARSQSFAFRCADGQLLAIHLSTREKFWKELTAVLASSDLAADERFATHQLRAQHYHALEAILSVHFRRRTRAEWVARLAPADVPFAPVHNISEALQDPQVRALGTLWEAEHPTEGRVISIQCPLLVDGARPVSACSAPPVIGEHTAEILAEIETRSAPVRAHDAAE
jgi:crotonobetainyl-CoA:carnitine CoA-transferase CaiB-like acyl-CoA transferase